MSEQYFYTKRPFLRTLIPGVSTDNYYLAGSRALTHVIFWLAYYVLFSLIWAIDGDYYRSFGLEFVLMPIRIGASYVSMYYLIPKFLAKGRVIKFLTWYAILMVVSALLIRVFMYGYYELLFFEPSYEIWTVANVIRAIVLINSTVMVLSAVKIYLLWQEALKKLTPKTELIEIRSEKRNYKIDPSSIQYIEGLGNYATFYIADRRPLISYMSLKEVEDILPGSFIRTHKSFVINRDHIKSYTKLNVEIAGRIIPIGKNVEVDL